MKPARSLDPQVIRPTGPWQHQDVAAGGLRFHVTHCPGDGQTLLLLHAFPQFSRAWLPLISRLKTARPELRIIAPDLRGCGGSDKQPQGYRLEQLSADMIALCHAMDAREVTVIGHGIGAQIGWLMAGTEPALVSALFTVASPHPLEIARLWGLVSPTVIAGRALAATPWLAVRKMEDGSLMRRIFSRWSAPQNRAKMLEASRPYTAALNMPQAAFGMLAHARRPYRFLAATKRALQTPLSIPVISIQGGEDPVFSARAYARDHNHVSDDKLYRAEVIASTGHFIPEENPDALARIILANI